MTVVAEPAPPQITYQRSHWCDSAARSDGQSLGGDKSGWHTRCKVAIRSTKPIKSGGVTVATRPQLLVCTCSCHVGPNQSSPTPRCLECGNQDEGEVDPTLWSCFDQMACTLKAEAKRASDPMVQMIRAAKQDGERARAETRARKVRDAERRNPMSDAPGGSAAVRERKPPKPKVGVCAHCGEATRGGTFVAGHDAKLKGILQRIAIDQGASSDARVDAIAEQLARGWHKGSWPDKLVTSLRGTGDSDEAKAQSLKEQREHVIGQYERLRDQAERLVKNDKDGLLVRVVGNRINK